MRIGKYLWGIAIYAVMSLFATLAITYGFTGGWLPHIVQMVLLLCLLAYASVALRLGSWKDILPYSALWMAEIVLLDLLLSAPFAGIAVLADPSVLVGYALVLIVPLLLGTSCALCGILGLPCPIHESRPSRG